MWDLQKQLEYLLGQPCNILLENLEKVYKLQRIVELGVTADADWARRYSKALHRKRLPLQWFMLHTHRRPHAIDPTYILASSCSLTASSFFTRCILNVWPSRQSVVPLDAFCPYLSEKKPLLGLMRAYRPSYYTEAS